MNVVAPDRTRSPAPGSLRPFHLPEIAEARLPGGLELRFVPDRRIPLVSGVLVVMTGESSIPAELAGLAGVAGAALLGGTARRDAHALAEALERQGTSFSVSVGWDATTISFTCAAERLNDTVALLAEIIREPSYPEAEVARVVRERKATLRQRRADPSDLADDEADAVLFGAGHPWGRSILGTEASLARIDRGLAASWVSEAFFPGGGGLVLVGDLDLSEMERIVERRLGDWSGTPPAPPPLPDVVLPDPRNVVIAHREGAVQSELRVVHTGPPRNTPDHAALIVANSILGGAFTSRLNLNLRERNGFTYGARSGWTLRRRGGGFAFSTAVGTEVTADALREAMTELRAFVAEGPTEEETERARDYLAGIFPLQMETAAQLASRVAGLISLGLEGDTLHRYRDRVRAVTREGAHDTTRRHLDPERAPIVLVADADAVGPSIEALGLGPVEVR